MLGVALVGTALTACGGSGGGGSAAPASTGPTTSAVSRTSSPTSTATRAPSTSSTKSSPGAGSSSSSAAPTPSAAAAAGATACQNGDLTVSGSVIGAGMGHSGAALVFTNTSGQACTLRGYPGVAGLNGAGKQVTQAERTLTGYLGSGYRVRTVRLAPGKRASALVEATSVPSGDATSCPTYAALLVTPPNTTKSVHVDVKLPGCGGLTVHPVVPGKKGRTS